MLRQRRRRRGWIQRRVEAPGGGGWEVELHAVKRHASKVAGVHRCRMKGAGKTGINSASYRSSLWRHFADSGFPVHRLYASGAEAVGR